MKKIIFTIVLSSLSFPAFAANHFECFKKTGRNTFEKKSSALLVPIARDLNNGAVLCDEAGIQFARTFEFRDSKLEPRTGTEWTHLKQLDPVETAGVNTILSIHSSGLIRSMFMVTMRGSSLVSAESYRCEEESSI